MGRKKLTPEDKKKKIVIFVVGKNYEKAKSEAEAIEKKYNEKFNILKQ